MCFALYGTWEALVGCEILPRGVGTFSTIPDTFLKNHFLDLTFQPICAMWAGNVFLQKHTSTFMSCLSQSASTKLVTMGSFHGFRETIHSLNKALAEEGSYLSSKYLFHIPRYFHPQR